MILTRMETAETYYGRGVTHAVVTVPACKLSQYIVNSLLTHDSSQISVTVNGRQRRSLAKLRDSSLF